MAFGNPHFVRKERTEWNEADEAQKEVIREHWFEAMLEEGSTHYNGLTSVYYKSPNLTGKKMETVKEESANLRLNIKDPFENPNKDDQNESIMISILLDAKEVVKWANVNGSSIEKLKSRTLDS